MFQLHPSGHLFAAGHVAKLELLPKDAGGANLNSYGRPANGQGDVTISNLDLRLPVLDGPGAAGGQVEAAPPLPLPCGQAIAPQYSSASYVRATLGTGKLKRKGRSAARCRSTRPRAATPARSRSSCWARSKKAKKGKRSQPSEEEAQEEGARPRQGHGDDRRAASAGS